MVTTNMEPKKAIDEMEQIIIETFDEQRLERAYHKLDELGLDVEYKTDWLERMSIKPYSRRASAGLSSWTEYIKPYDILDDMLVLQHPTSRKISLTERFNDFMERIVPNNDRYIISHWKSGEIRSCEGIVDIWY
jgi:hypothetical protein